LRWIKNELRRVDAERSQPAEGGPMLILERGEKVQLPPAVGFAARGDAMHDYKDLAPDYPGNEPQRFVAAYRRPAARSCSNTSRAVRIPDASS
jgi:hypothetical protein